MLSQAKEKLIRSLRQQKAREQTGLCLVEGKKTIEVAGTAIDFTFTPLDTPNFARLVTTEAPQDVAAVAKIPQWSIDDINQNSTLVVLDGVQDPGNVGAILRLCLGFNAALLLIESADVTAPKVIRASVGAVFQVPWMKMTRVAALDYLNSSARKIFRLEKRAGASAPDELKTSKRVAIIAGSEGQGIHLAIAGTSITIPHNKQLESLNVTHALAIALFCRQ